MEIIHLSPQPRCEVVDATGSRCARPESHGDDRHDAYNGSRWVPPAEAEELEIVHRGTGPCDCWACEDDQP